MAMTVLELVDEVDEAEIFLGQSLRVLHDFDDRWFSDAAPTAETIHDITHRYGLMQAHLWLIINGLHGAEERLQNVIKQYTGGVRNGNGSAVEQ